MIESMREPGAVINYNIMMAIAEEIVTANDRTLLKENGGIIELWNKLRESVTKRIGFIKSKATTAKPIIAPGLISEIEHRFYHSINEIAKAHDIPPEIIINIDQTFLPFIHISKYTLEEKVTLRVSFPGTVDYRQITSTFGITMAGRFLPIQLIYHGKTLLTQPKYKFRKELHVAQTPNHWANKEASIAFLELVLISYIETQREELNSSSPWLLISVIFKGQWTDHVKEIVRRSNGKMVSVPNNWTGYYQTLDLTVNKSYKDFLWQGAQK